MRQRLRKLTIGGAAALAVAAAGAPVASAQGPALPQLRVSDNHRFLQTADNQPFFWQADTGWELFHRLNRAEATLYLRDRASKGFNVVQAVALSELNGLTEPNAYGDLPLIDRDPARPAVTDGADPADAQQYDYWDQVDAVVKEANQQGIYVAMLPTWGSWVLDGTINITNAETYGRFLGQRYKNAGIVWVLGGDRPATGFENVWRALAKGIAIGVSGTEDYSKVLMTYHPPGSQTSAAYFPQDEKWLDFNMQQNGHCPAAESRTWEKIGRDYALTPTKPVLDGEPLYENHPICFQAATRGYSDAALVRQYAYLDVFAGAFGHTYGHHSVWQMHDPKRGAGVNGPQNYWYEGIAETGSGQIQYLHRLIDSRPFLTRVPDNSLVTRATGCPGPDRVEATRDQDRTYALIYSTTGQPFTVDLDAISGKKLTAWWLDPRTGEASSAGRFNSKGKRDFIPPSSGRGNDWVLVLDDAARNYPAPGPVVKAPKGNERPAPAFAAAAPITLADGALYKAFNLNGPALTIGGESFAAGDSPGLCVDGPTFANQSVKLDPPTDDARAQMIRDSVYNGSVTVTGVPQGSYDVFVYVWEDNASDDYSLLVDDREVAKVTSGPAGHWERLGPFRSQAPGGAVKVGVSGGDGNLSGIELRAPAR